MKKLIVLILFALVVPVQAFAQPAPPASGGFSRQGIFGCSRNAAALSSSVGAFSATGGVYVPVADFTTELNTGTLVYQQCVLRGIVNRESESASVAQIQRVVQTITTGNQGNAYFVVNQRLEDLEFRDGSRLRFYQNPNYVGAMNPQFASNVQRASARAYMQQTRNREASLRCNDLPANATGLNAISGDPACYDIGAYFIYENMALEDDIRNAIYLDNEREWGDGFYAVTQTDANGDRIVQTPGIINKEITTQALTSGFRRVENANDIDQMVGALYAGLGTQALSGSGGLLTGLTSPIGNNPSFLTRMTSESSAGLRNAAANAALQILAAARAIEAQYNQVVSAIANNLTGTIAQIRSVENQCWSLIAFNTTSNHVCTAEPTGNTCTNAAGVTLRIATSTQFSQPIIDAQIAPIATQAVQNIQRSQQALTQIDALIQGVSNTASLDAQRLALVQLDQLVAQGRLHVQADVTAVQQQQSAVADAMTQLVEQTKVLWADNPDVNQGWCNVNNQAVLDMWDQRWR